MGIAGELRSRVIRQRILTVLREPYEADLEVGYTAAQIAAAISAAVHPAEGEMTSLLRLLGARGLIERVEAADTWRLTADGYQFCTAGCPWELVDRFTRAKGKLKG